MIVHNSHKLRHVLVMQSMAVSLNVLAYAGNYFQPRVGTADQSAGRGTIQCAVKRERERKSWISSLFAAARGPGSRRGRGQEVDEDGGERPPLRASPLEQGESQPVVASWESKKA